MTTPKQCGECHHWVELEQAKVLLGEPKQGQCRESPPQQTIIIDPANLQPRNMVLYPTMPETFPPCSKAEPRD